MVRCSMYCAEQIVVPESLPNILKSYAKDVIKTQPYDLLRWSAAYFRCLSLGIQPPVKQRLEKKSCFGTLTKGYLKILVEQLGKGFYVHRDVLQKKWEGLSLPEDLLLKFLSLSRMYNWTQIHWLKLFAVLVGSISGDLRESVYNLCELLTEDVEGSPSPIPMWIYRECFVFIAELDCSQEQNFMNGRKILDDGELEPEMTVPEGPKWLSTTAFRDAIIDEWKKRLDEISICGDTPVSSSVTSIETPTSATVMSQLLNCNEAEETKHSPDFNNILDILHGIKSNELIKRNITRVSYEEGIKRELEIVDKKAYVQGLFEEQAKKLLETHKIELLREIGPPWSWLHQFASQNCRSKSYNFVECDGSDVVEEQDDNLKRNTVDEIVKEIVDNVIKPEIECNRVSSDTASLCSFMADPKNCPVESRVVDFGPLKQYIQDAEEQELEFKDMDELFDYLTERCKQDDITAPELSSQIFGEKVPSPTATPDVTTVTTPGSASKVASHETIDDCEIMSNKSNVASGGSHKSEIGSVAAAPPEVTATTAVEETQSDANTIESIFVESGIELDERVLSKGAATNMILGLSEAPPCPEVVSSHLSTVEESLSSQSRITTTTEMSSGSALLSDGSSKVSLQVPESRRKKYMKQIEPEFIEIKTDFICSIPPINGIGAAMTERNMQKLMTFMKVRSDQQNGMIYPRNFKETECPFIFEPKAAILTNNPQ